MPPASTTDSVVSTQGLLKQYGELRALGPLTVEVPKGAVGLLGPNGAGKTTLIKTLLGLIPPTQGEARVLGLRVRHQSQDIRQRVGYMPELEAQITQMSGLQYVAYAGELAGLPRRDAQQRAHEILDYVGLDEERYRNVETYSTGMRQRAKLAQAIVHDPRLVFLDEPTNGLDPKGRDEMLQLIRDLAYKRGMAVILSSHLLPDVEFVCGWVVVLNKGQVAASGSIEQLKRRDMARYTVRVKGDEAGFVERLQRAGCQTQVDEEGMLHVGLPATRDANLLLDIAIQARVQLRHFHPERSTLEDVFMKTVGAE